MKNSFNDIDNFLRDSFEDFTSEPAPALRSNVSTSVRKFNFFRFNPMNFNIFYLVAIIVGTGTIVSFASVGSISENGKSIEHPTENIFQSIKIEKAPASKEIIPIDSNNKIACFNKQVAHNDIKKTDSQNIISTISEKSSTQNLITESSKNDDASTAISKNENIVNQQNNISENYNPVEKTVIFDTIIENVKIIFTDTINVNVKKTVEIKRKRKNLK